jgi:hypothetical protein
MRFLPEEWKAKHGGYPEDEAIIERLLRDPDGSRAILDRLETDVNEWTNSEHERSWHNPALLLADMREVMLPSVIFPDGDFKSTRNFAWFITEDEIDAHLTRGSNVSEGKFRILSYFLGDHSEKERINFLKDEYGHGGGTWTEGNGWYDYEPGKGITLKRDGSIFGPEAEVNIGWGKVVKRVERLIQGGRYMTRAELDRLPNYEKLMLARSINNFYYDLSKEEYDRPFEGLEFYYPHEAEWEALRDLLDNPANVDTLLVQMEPIYTNTSEEDRHYSSRKTAWDNLNDYRNGTYTLFPGLENLPDPEAVVTTRFNGTRREPVRQAIIDLDDRPTFSEITQNSQQLSIFDIIPLPVLPSVDEQRAKIDETLKQEAENADAPFLNIADADKARIAKQFTDAPRSREAASLVRDVYGDSLNMPLPQAIKQITELVADGKFAVPEYHKLPILQECERIKRENDGAIVMYQIGDFFEMYVDDATTASDVLDLTLTQSRVGLPEAVSLCGIPRHTLGDYARKLNEAGYAVAVSNAGENGERSVFLYPAKPTIEPVEYKIGDRLMYNGRLHEITQIGDFVRVENRDLDNPARYPIFDNISIRRDDFERMLSDGEISTEPPQDELDEMEMEYVFDEPDTPIELDFDAVAQTVLERVMSDDSYKAALANATSRASLRNPCTMAVELSIRDHFNDEREVFRQYFSNDDFNDNLFDYVLRQSWEQRPRPEAEQTAQFAEVTDHAESAEIEAVFGGTEEHEQPVNPPKSYVEGSRIVLDLRAKHTGLVGEFHIDAVSADTITVSKNSFAETITRAEAERCEIQPIAERVYREPDTGYYLMRYPEGVAAGARFGLDEIPLITEYSKQYVICAEACYLSETDMERWNITFRKMPRDWNLLPSEAQAEIRKYKPEYETQWQEYFGNTEQTAIEQEQPRYQIQQTAFVQAIRSNPASVGLEKPTDFKNYLILDSEENRYVNDPHGEHIGFATEHEAQDYADRLNRGEIMPPLPFTANFRITDDHLGEGGAKLKYQRNIDAIEQMKKLKFFPERGATPEEQEIMSQYVGWGGLPQVFDPNNKQWEDEYKHLKFILTDAEYDSARASTLNAHYTSPTIIKAMWETIERLGFKSGNILEPSMGVGNFYGLLPDELAKSKLYGVELDSVTASIAAHLYPNANIQQTGFEKTLFSDSFFDLAIGNVPFGEYGVSDKRYDQQSFSIHNYFFAKSLDKVRPGGIVAFVTSKYTMDERNPKVRKYIAQRAELLGAVRLPNNASLKNAGTETTMDILFLQKRDRPLDIEPEWVHLGLTDDGIPVNRYFLDNPEMVCGTMALDEHMNNKYGRDDCTACLPIEGADLAEQLKTATSYIQGEYSVTELEDLEGVDDHAIPADSSVKNFSYALVGEQVYFRENSLMYPVDLTATTLDRIKGMIGLRDCVQELISLQLDEHSDAEI